MSAEYDEMRARIAAEGVRPPVDADAALAANRRLVEAEWRGMGFEPVPNGDGSLSAPSTLKSVGRWPPQVKKAAPDRPPPDLEFSPRGMDDDR